jgi:hypothetical protein
VSSSPYVFLRKQRGEVAESLIFFRKHLTRLLSQHSTLNSQLLTDLVRRSCCPAADTEGSQHDFHGQRAKDESHYTDENGRALATDHPQNYEIRVSEMSEKFSLLFWRERGDDFLEARVPSQWVP